MCEIVEVHFSHIPPNFLFSFLTMFYELRDIKGLKKLPSTSELIDWIRLLLADELEEGADIAIEQLSHPSNGLPPMIGALIKNEADISLLQRLGFTLSRK